MAMKHYSIEDWLLDVAWYRENILATSNQDNPNENIGRVADYFLDKYPMRHDALFRYNRFSCAVRFINANIHSFTVGGIAFVDGAKGTIGPALFVALWEFFGNAADEYLKSDVDPQAVLDRAESVLEAIERDEPWPHDEEE